MLRIIYILIISYTYASFANEQVVFIHSYPPGVWYNGMTKGASDVFSKSNKFKIKNLLYDYESLRFKSNNEQNAAAIAVAKQANSSSAKYIVINDDEAIEKVYEYLDKNKTILLNGLNQHFKYDPVYSKMNLNKHCGIIEHYPVKRSLDMISLMSKDIKQMSILSSDGKSSLIVTNIFKDLKANPYKNIKVREILNSKNWAEWKKSLKEFNKKDDLIWVLVPFEVFEGKRAVPISEMATWMRENINKPTLGILSIHTKMGFLSAISVTPEGLGKQVAEMVLDIEKGKECKNIGFQKSKYHAFEVNISEVERLKLKVPEEFFGIAEFLNDKDIF